MSYWSFQSWTTCCLTICVFVLDCTSNLAIQFSWVCYWLFTLTKSNHEFLVFLIIIVKVLRSLELIVHNFVALVCQFFQTCCVVSRSDWLTWLTAFNDLSQFLITVSLVYEADNRFLTILHVIDWCILSWITWNWWWVVTLAWIARIFRCQWSCAIWAYWSSAWYMWNYWKISTWFAWICWIVWIWKIWYFWKSLWYIWYVWTKFLVLNNFFAVSVTSFHCLRCYISLICHKSSYYWCTFLCQFFRSWCPCTEGFNASYTVTFTCTCEGCFLSYWSFQSWTTFWFTICVLVLDRTSNLVVQLSWVRIVIQARSYNNCPCLILCFIFIKRLTIWLSETITYKCVTSLFQLFDTSYCWVRYWFTWLTSHRVCVKSLNWHTVLTICYVLDRAALLIQVILDNLFWIRRSRSYSDKRNWCSIWSKSCNARRRHFWKSSTSSAPSAWSFNTCHFVHRDLSIKWCWLSDSRRKRWTSFCYTITILIFNSTKNLFCLASCLNTWS